MKTNKSFRGIAWWAGAAAATTMGVVACGSDFSSDDCKANRTCPAAGGDGAADGGAQSGNAANAGGAGAAAAAGQPSGGAAGTTTPGGAGGATTNADAGGAGGAPEPECRVAKDCSNGDPTDGEEICKNGSCAAGNPPPTVVSVSPKDKAVDVEPDGSIVITFSETLDPQTVTEANIQVLDGATAIPTGKPTYADGKVTLKPTAPLALLTPYSVSVSITVADAEGATLLAPFKSTFFVRDGAWTVTTAVTDTIYQLAPSLPMTDDGQSLVTWVAISSGSEFYCPTMARWFGRGAGLGAAAKKLTGDDAQECADPRAAGIGDGHAVVSWRENAGSKAVMYKDGTWQPAATVSPQGNALYQSEIAHGPGDMAHYLKGALAGGIDAYWWDLAQAKWTSDPFHVSSETVLSQPQITVAKNGRAYAVWRAQDATNHVKVMSAMYEPDLKTWAVAQVLKGSTALGTGVGYERGAPSIAVDENGGAIALWVRGTGNGTSYQLMSSRYRDSSTGWEDANAISGGLSGFPLDDPPALVFDGKTYAAAWTALAGGVNNTYVARFDRQSEAWSEYRRVSDGVANSVSRMPRLGADGHQNLLVTWPVVTTTADVFKLTYQRYNATTGAWATAAQVPGGTMSDADLAVASPFPLGVSSSGAAAAMWGVSSGGIPGVPLSAIRLASLY